MTKFDDHRADAVELTRAALSERLDRYLPDPDYRAFYAWALSEQNPDQTIFHRIIALTQLGNLTAAMLTDLAGSDTWSALVRHAVPVNLYQIFEVVSDNLGLGLAKVAPGQQAERRDLLLDFNAAAAADLRDGLRIPATALLAPLKERCGRLSGFELSLTTPFHATIADGYRSTVTQVRAASLEHSVWSGLVANVESGRDVLTAIGGTHSEPLVRARTIDRYRAVDRTLTATWLSRDELVETSRHAILVTPTLAYFGAVFGELLDTDPAYPAALADGALAAAFDTAALLVRLQNDVGTTLLRVSRPQRAALIGTLRESYGIDGPDTAIGLLTRALAHPALNRFRKDLLNGEFNICLYEARRADDLDDGLGVLLDDLDYSADLYARQTASLRRQLAELELRLRDRRIVEVTRRFVRFHERLYAHPYDDLAGDYAI